MSLGLMMPAPADLAGWQADCAARFGVPNEHVSWLHLDWYADDDVHRLLVYQMTPLAKAGHFCESLVLGPPPVRYKGKIVAGPMMLRQQWDLSQRFRCWPQPYWIIQGDKGGHKRKFTEQEAKLLKLYGLPTAPPVAGALPFAPWDTRVTDKLHALDQMIRWNHCEEFAERSWATLERDEQQAVEAMKREHLAWLESQVDAAFDSVNTLQSPVQIDTDPNAESLDWDAAKHDLITEPT